MNKHTTWIVLAVIVIALALWYFNRGEGASNQTTSTDGTSSRSSMSQLMASGRPVSCSYSSPDSGEGTVYVSGQKLRADYMVAGTSGHMINDGEFAYIWTEGTNQGFKMDASDDTEVEAEESQTPDLDAEGDYNCKPWAATSSAFTPPTDVTFSTFPNQ